jgi:hypothetical protein
MNKLIHFIEKNKFGIFTAVLLHALLFIYFQITTYEVKVHYEPWNFQGRNIEAPDDIILEPDQIILPEEQTELDFPMEDITSFVKDEQDRRERSFDERERYTSYQGDPMANVKALESEILQQLGEKREKSVEGGNGNKAKSQEKQGGESGGEAVKESSGAAASEKAVAGETMVSYSLTDRKPFNNNDWHVRNPGYTCGNVNGKIVVAIKVNPAGEVISAKYIPELSPQANYCMIRQAEKYALMSKFNYSESAPRVQEGTITYQFVFRR